MRPSEDFIYAVSRIRAKETKLLNDKHIEQLISLPDIESVIRFLIEKGWGSDGSLADTSKDILSIESVKLWDLMQELINDLSDFDFLRIQNDFHNLKASIKAVYTDIIPDDLFLSGSKYNPETIYNCIKNSEYSALPEKLVKAAEKAHKTLLKTGDGQLCDVIIDKACLSSVYEYGKLSTCQIVRMYCELFVASADIKIAVRGTKLSKSREFMLNAMCRCDSLDVEKLSKSAAKGLDEVVSYLQTTDYRNAVEKIKISLSAFEKWCDNRIIAMAKDSKYDPFTIAPLVSYVIAKMNEIKAVRLILTSKENFLDNSVIRERVRDMYV